MSRLGSFAAVWLLVASAACMPMRAPERVQSAPAVMNASAASNLNAPPDAATQAPSDDSAVSSEQAEESDVIDDHVDTDNEEPNGQVQRIPHPFDAWPQAELERAVAHDLPSLGSLSLGSPNAGALLNGVQAEDSELLRIVSPSAAWATRETLEYLQASLRKVHAEHPGTPALDLGDISAKNGGAIRPHISHQSGRDVDISYFYKDGQRWYARGTAQNLDLERNWAFVRALISETDVEMILIDNSIQALLKRHALEIGEDPEWVEAIFRGKAAELRPLIRHARGHATHIHIRFYNPIAQESARRAHDLLVKQHLVAPAQNFTTHRVKKGETLGMIAKKYRTSVPALRAANGLRSSLIRERSALRVPQAVGVRVRKDRVSIPPRRPPPPRRSTAPAMVQAGEARGPNTAESTPRQSTQ